MEWYLLVLRKFSDFNGRSRRKEYWMFILFNILISVVLTLIDLMLGTYHAASGLGLLSGIYALFILVPGIAVSVRRLHDIGKSGWMLFICLIPFIGAIWLIVLMATDGTPGENQYGLNPKETIIL